MPTEANAHSGYMSVFPSADQFPLGSPYGRLAGRPTPASAVRPFGLTLAVLPRDSIRFNPDELGYDDIYQIGLVRVAGAMVPMAKHTDGLTNTRTNADGQYGPDSDTDIRED